MEEIPFMTTKTAGQTEIAERFLCIASYEKGQAYLRQLEALGVRPFLITVEKLANADWPREILDDQSVGRSGAAMVARNCSAKRAAYCSTSCCTREGSVERTSRPA